MKKILCLIVAALILSGCAVIYKPIRPETVEFNAHPSAEGVDFWYRYDVLAYRGNNRYAKKERKNGFNVLAVKITNNTSRPINFARDLELGITRGPVYPTDSETASETIRQKVWLHLLWGLLGYSESECNGDDCRTTTFIPFGLAIAAINIGVAAGSNDKLKKEFEQYSLYNKDIAPGETVYGIIPLRDIGFQPLAIRVKPEKTGGN
ncbi:MAG: hypothetical protein E6Q96_06975 [Cyclobacteriaceae bacterium]|nr:MAG: hypothetical protein E6Q96_06975 [Cyclobacteriaceae bacterium]